MDESTRWARIEEIFHQTLERPANEHDAFVRATCAGDADLEDRVRALLRAESRAERFLDTPVARVSDVSREGKTDGHAPTFIGPYRLIRPLGVGGMGEVFLAAQDEDDFRRFVAIKLIRGEGVGSGFQERFARERSILAQLAHPGIARFLGGGTADDGRPYFVMEHVEGERIDDYADRRLLSVRERVELIRQVALAVQHAHSNLVVHRDLKPGNILVTPDGTPKLLDFGIAKLLDDDQTERTQTLFRVATPEYAAPEQLRGDPVSTSSDVYSLGVLLYSLLSGHRPHTVPQALARSVEPDPTEPAPPSVASSWFSKRTHPDGEEETVTPEDVGAKRRVDPGGLRRAIRGDLDNVVLKALRFGPSGRYISAAALADDLERYLTGRPVRARGDSLSYRTAKFVRRNRAATLAAGALVVTLLGATIATSVQNREIREQAQRIRGDRDRAVAVQGFLLETLGAAPGDVEAGVSSTVREVLDRQAALVDRQYADRPETHADMLHALAEGYERVGGFTVAKTLASRSLEVRRGLGRPDREPEIARTLDLLGWITYQLGDFSAADSLLMESLSLWRAHAADSVGLSRALNDLSSAAYSLGRTEDAVALAQEALDIRRTLLGASSREVGISLNNLAAAVSAQGKNEEALQLFEESSRVLEGQFGPDHVRTLNARRNVALMHAAMGEWETAAAIHKEVLDGLRAAVGEDHLLTGLAYDVYAYTLFALRRYEEADTVLRTGIDVLERTAGDHPYTADAYLTLARLRNAQRRRTEAARAARESIGMFGRLADGGDNGKLAEALGMLGALTTERSEQLDSYRQSADMYRRLRGIEDPVTVRQVLNRARALSAAGEFDEAAPLFDSLAIWIPIAYGPEHPYVVAPHLGLAEVLLRSGDLDAARPSLERARALMVGPADAPANRAWLGRVEALLSQEGSPTGRED